MKSTEKNKIVRVLGLLLIFMLVFTVIPAMPGEAASTKSKAISAYKKKLSASKVTVLPAGKKVMNRNDDYVTYRYSKRAKVKFAIAMTEPRTVEGKHFRGMDYGYLWWIISRKKGIYEDIAWSEGTPFTKCFYQFKNGKMTGKLHKFVYEQGRPEADYYQTSSSSRYPKEISKAVFKKKLKSYVGNTKVTKLSLKSNTSSNRKKYLR